MSRESNAVHKLKPIDLQPTHHPKRVERHLHSIPLESTQEHVGASRAKQEQALQAMEQHDALIAKKIQDEAITAVKRQEIEEVISNFRASKVAQLGYDTTIEVPRKLGIFGKAIGAMEKASGWLKKKLGIKEKVRFSDEQFDSSSGKAVLLEGQHVRGTYEHKPQRPFEITSDAAEEGWFEAKIDSLTDETVEDPNIIGRRSIQEAAIADIDQKVDQKMYMSKVKADGAMAAADAHDPLDNEFRSLGAPLAGNEDRSLQADAVANNVEQNIDFERNQTEILLDLVINNSAATLKDRVSTDKALARTAELLLANKLASANKKIVEERLRNAGISLEELQSAVSDAQD